MCDGKCVFSILPCSYSWPGNYIQLPPIPEGTNNLVLDSGLRLVHFLMLWQEHVRKAILRL